MEVLSGANNRVGYEQRTCPEPEDDNHDAPPVHAMAHYQSPRQRPSGTRERPHAPWSHPGPGQVAADLSVSALIEVVTP